MYETIRIRITRTRLKEEERIERRNMIILFSRDMQLCYMWSLFIEKYNDMT